MDKIKMSCVAIDDEQLALDKIEMFIAKVPFLELKASFTNPLQALDFLKSNDVDILFLDIQMDDISGIQLLKILQKRPQVILTTAYQEYAVESYEIGVTDYLMKPISFDRFLKSVSKAADNANNIAPHLETHIIEPNKHKPAFIFVKTEYRMQKVFIKDILYIEGMKDYLRFITTAGNIMTLQNFKNAMAALPEDNFCRVHRSFIVALDKINCIEKDRIVIGEKRIPIGDTYREEFHSILNKLGI